VPLDDDGTWFRYHHLFQGLLLLGLFVLWLLGRDPPKADVP